jgi:glutamate 5-kinase
VEPLDERRDAERKHFLEQARRVVVKVGTSIVTAENGDLAAERVDPIVHSISGLMRAGRQVVLVSSGAVGLGRGWLGLHRARLEDLVTKQACAAVGQSLLMEAYKRLFSAWDIKVAQVLLTEDDFSVWRRHSNLQHTIERLWQFGVLPIINENDTVSTAEIESLGPSSRRAAFSDNDRLAALVMSGLGADVLVLLTNVDGLLRRKPRKPEAGRPDAGEAQVVSAVDRITPELLALAAGPSANGRGGMITKLRAAEIAMSCGGMAVIASGSDPGTLDRLFAGDSMGTTFFPAKRIKGKRRWIVFAAGVAGRIVVDAGAQQAMTKKKASLLASGVLRVENQFSAKDVVSITDKEGREFARGIAACSSREAADPAENQSSRSSRIVVRRDNIVLLENP